MLESRVSISVTACGFRCGRIGVWVGFLKGFLPSFPTTNFIPSFLHIHLIHVVLFHPILRWCDRRGWQASLLFRPSNIAHSPTLPSLYLRHNSFSNPSVASPTLQLILQPFFRFYVTGSSLTSPGEPPMNYSISAWSNTV